MGVDPFLPINHCLFKGILIFFVLPKDLEREQFEKCVRLLQAKAHTELNADLLSAYWGGIQERIEGKSRWDRIAPWIEPGGDIEQQKKAFLAQNNIDNLAKRRP